MIRNWIQFYPTTSILGKIINVWDKIINFIPGRSQQVYVGNLRLFEKEARAKYLKKVATPDEQTIEAAKIDQR